MRFNRKLKLGEELESIQGIAGIPLFLCHLRMVFGPTHGALLYVAPCALFFLVSNNIHEMRSCLCLIIFLNSKTQIIKSTDLCTYGDFKLSVTLFRETLLFGEVPGESSTLDTVDSSQQQGYLRQSGHQ